MRPSSSEDSVPGLIESMGVKPVDSETTIFDFLLGKKGDLDERRHPEGIQAGRGCGSAAQHLQDLGCSLRNTKGGMEGRKGRREGRRRTSKFLVLDN